MRDSEASRCGRAITVPREHSLLSLAEECRGSSLVPRLTSEAFGSGCDMRLSHVCLAVWGWTPGGAAASRFPVLCFCTEEGKRGCAVPVSEMLGSDAAPLGESIK